MWGACVMFLQAAQPLVSALHTVADVACWSAALCLLLQSASHLTAAGSLSTAALLQPLLQLSSGLLCRCSCADPNSAVQTSQYISWTCSSQATQPCQALLLLLCPVHARALPSCTRTLQQFLGFATTALRKPTCCLLPSQP